MTKRPTEAWRSAKLFEVGIGHVIVARFKGSGEAEVGVFLLDVYCLGAKDAFFSRMSAHEYETRLLGQLLPEEERFGMTLACARKLIEDAVAYARRSGIEPCADYKKAGRVLGGIKVADCGESFTFGKDGKPLYISGPHDSPSFISQVVRVMTAKLGTEGFHYLVRLAGPDEFPDDEMDET